MSETAASREPVLAVDSRSGLEWVAAGLAVVTGVIHLSLGLTRGIPQFTAAGVGFLLGVAVFLTRYWRRPFYLVAALYAAVQVVLWVQGGMRLFEIAVVDKAVQVAFVAVVLYLYWRG